MTWITKNGKSFRIAPRHPTIANLNELNRQDEARKKIQASRKKTESTRGYEVNIGFDPYLRIKRETKVTENK